MMGGWLIPSVLGMLCLPVTKPKDLLPDILPFRFGSWLLDSGRYHILQLCHLHLLTAMQADVRCKPARYKMTKAGQDTKRQKDCAQE